MPGHHPACRETGWKWDPPRQNSEVFQGVKLLPWEPTSLTYQAPPTLTGLGVLGLIKNLYICKLDILPTDPYHRAEVKPFFLMGKLRFREGK